MQGMHAGKPNHIRVRVFVRECNVVELPRISINKYLGGLGEREREREV
jgi:hypothetical protein